LPAETLAYRLEVLETTMKAGDAVEKIDSYRELFERNGFALTASSHMRQLIPVLAKRFKDNDALAVEGKIVSVIFDGTDHFGELLIVFIRYWTGSEWKQRLVRLRHSEHPLDTRSLAFILDRACLGVKIENSNVLGFIKDSVAVNFSAVSKLIADSNYTMAENLPCWSHILNRIGKKFNLPLALTFIKSWSSFFAKSLKVLLIASFIMSSS
jgi:hypothetical protein